MQMGRTNAFVGCNGSGVCTILNHHQGFRRKRLGRTRALCHFHLGTVRKTFGNSALVLVTADFISETSGAASIGIKHEANLQRPGVEAEMRRKQDLHQQQSSMNMASFVNIRAPLDALNVQ